MMNFDQYPSKKKIKSKPGRPNRKLTLPSSLTSESGAIWSAVVQFNERPTPGEEVVGSIPAVAARSLLVWSVSV